MAINHTTQSPVAGRWKLHVIDEECERKFLVVLPPSATLIELSSYIQEKYFKLYQERISVVRLQDVQHSDLDMDYTVEDALEDHSIVYVKHAQARSSLGPLLSSTNGQQTGSHLISLKQQSKRKRDNDFVPLFNAVESNMRVEGQLYANQELTNSSYVDASHLDKGKESPVPTSVSSDVVSLSRKRSKRRKRGKKSQSGGSSTTTSTALNSADISLDEGALNSTDFPSMDLTNSSSFDQQTVNLSNTSVQFAAKNIITTSHINGKEGANVLREISPKTLHDNVYKFAQPAASSNTGPNHLTSASSVSSLENHRLSLPENFRRSDSTISNDAIQPKQKHVRNPVPIKIPTVPSIKDLKLDLSSVRKPFILQDEDFEIDMERNNAAISAATLESRSSTPLLFIQSATSMPTSPQSRNSILLNKSYSHQNSSSGCSSSSSDDSDDDDVYSGENEKSRQYLFPIPNPAVQRSNSFTATTATPESVSVFNESYRQKMKNQLYMFRSATTSPSSSRRLSYETGAKETMSKSSSEEKGSLLAKGRKSIPSLLGISDD